MNGMQSRTASVSGMRLVLVLQQEHAYWFKIIDSRIVDRHIEGLVMLQHENHVQCPWSISGDDTPQRVELILDSTLDEVNRVSVSRSPNWLVNAYRRWVTLRRARRDFPRDRVYPLPVGYQEQVAAIMHTLIPEQWTRWLLALQARHVVFHQVSMGNTLIERWSRYIGGRMLLLVSSDRNQRHMLVDNGATVFLRSVPMPGDREPVEGEAIVPACASMPVGASAIPIDRNWQDTDSLLQSLAHISDSGLDGAGPVRIVRPVGSAMHPGELRSVDGVAGNKSVECLIAMLLDVPIAYRLSEWKNNTLVGSECCTSSNGVDAAALDVSFYRSRVFPWFRHLVIARWSSHRVLGRLDALTPSYSYLRLSQRRMALHLLSLVLACVACLAVISATANGIVKFRAARNTEALHVKTERSISDVRSSARQLFEYPEMMAASLSLYDQLTPPESVLADFLLDTVATTLTSAPYVSLDQLVWVRIENDDVYESLGYALVAVPGRQRVEASANEVDIQLEISGKVMGSSLEQQKNNLDEFIGLLGRLDAVVMINLLESPVDIALSSDHRAHSFGNYRMSVNLGGRS